MNALIPASLKGEVLPASVCVTWISHPIKETREVHYLPAGATLAEIVDEVCGTRAGITAWADGRKVAPEDWGGCLPAEDVLLRRVPGPVLLPLIPILAATLATATGVTAAVATAIGVSVAVAGAIISVGASLLSFGIGMLLKPSQPSLKNLSNAQPSPTYSITGSGNAINQFGVVPFVLGRHRIYPPYAAKPWTQIVGGDQYLNGLFIVGYGTDLAVTEVKIGETPISNFTDVVVSVHHLPAGGTLPRTLARPARQENLSIDLGTVEDPAPAVTRTTAENTDAIGIDLVAPSGVSVTYTDGTVHYWHSTFRIEYRLVGSPSWTVWNGGYLVDGRVRGEVVRKGIYFEVDTGQYEVRITNRGLGPSGINDDNLYSDQVLWTALRSHTFEQPVHLPYDATLLSLRIKANEQLSGQIDTLNCKAEYRDYKYVGDGEWGSGYDPNPAAQFRNVLQGSGNARPVEDDGIDLDALAQWWNDCAAHGWKYHRVHDFEASVYDALRDICAAGRAEPAFIDGKWSVIWERSTPVVQVFTPRSTLSFQGERSYLPQLQGVRVRFVNEDMGFGQDERVVYDDDFDASTADPGRIEGLELPGVTDPDLIWKIGRYHIAQQRLRRERYTVDVDIQQVACRRGDRVKVNHDVPLWGLGFGRVAGIDGHTLVLDEPVTMVDGTPYAMGFKSVDAGGHNDIVRTIQTEAGEQDRVTLTGNGDMPAVGDEFFFGELGSESVVLRVQSIQPREDGAATLALVDDAPGVLTADSGTIPPFDTNITLPATALDFKPTDLRLTTSAVQVGGQPMEEIRVSFVPPELHGIVRNEVQWRAGNETSWSRALSLDPSAREAVVRVPPGEWKFRVRSHLGAPLGLSNVLQTAWSDVATISARSVYGVPPDVTGARIALVGKQAVLTWDVVANMSGVEIRHSRALTGAVPSSARVVVSNAQNGTATVAATSGTYLLRWKSLGGTFSAHPAEIVTNAPDLINYNVIETVTEDPTFAGTATGLTVSSGNLVRDAAAGTGTYDFANQLDLGAVFPVRLALDVSASAFDTTATIWNWPSIWGRPIWMPAPEDWSVRLLYRSTEDDPAGSPTWSDWREIEITDVVGRAFQFRIEVTNDRDEVKVSISGLAAIADMPDRIEDVANDYTLSAAGETFTFSPAFMETPVLSVTLQNAPTGARYSITGKSASGFTLQVFNSSGTGISAVVDVMAKGYGQVQA